MRTIIFLLGMLVALTGMAQKYELNTALSEVTWKAYKVTGEHYGTIDLAEGYLTMENGKVKGGAFTLDTPSITVTDLEGSGKAKLEGHLKSEDFFDTEKFQTASFVITEVNGDKVKGTAVIKNISGQLEFSADLNIEEGKVAATAEIKIDRTNYDIRYNSKKWYGNLGDKMIYDDFDISVSLVAVQ